jgi:hypothetical protein
MTRLEFDFDGRPVTETTSAQPFFSFVNNDTGIRVNPELHYEKGGLLLYEMPPGHYGLTIDVDANMRNPLRFPGDLFYQAVLNVDRCEHCDRSVFHYDLMKIIHLTAPSDNSGKVHIFGVDCGLEHVPVASPVVFSWDPVADDADYEYTIYRMSLGPERSWAAVGGGRTKETAIRVALPQSKENEYYLIQMNAFRSGRPVGILMSQGLCHFTASYQFTVGGGGHE